MNGTKPTRSLVLKAALTAAAGFALACGGFFAYISLTDAEPGLFGGERCCEAGK